MANQQFPYPYSLYTDLHHPTWAYQSHPSPPARLSVGKQQTKIKSDTGAQTRRLSFLAYLFNHILHCIFFKIHFAESKYLVSNW